VGQSEQKKQAIGGNACGHSRTKRENNAKKQMLFIFVTGSIGGFDKTKPSQQAHP
jgi:hypothetical protein